MFEVFFFFAYLVISNNIIFFGTKIIQKSVCKAPDKHSLYFFYTVTIITSVNIKKKLIICQNIQCYMHG